MSQDFFFRGEALMPAPFYVWGVVNITTDSFHDGGCYSLEENAIKHALKLWSEGAAVLDIGGASSRPNAKDVPAAEEWSRISGVIQAIKNTPKQELNVELAQMLRLNQENSYPLLLPSFRPCISVDTWRAEVARKALDAGADIINDISAFSWEEDLLDVVAEYKPGYVLMHCQGRPQNMQNKPLYVDVVEDIIHFFEEKMNILVQKGLPENHIILDMGIGFGKNVKHNLALLQATQKLIKLGRPILLGISYKSFFGHLLGIETEKREMITQVCTALMAQEGIRHHRVHDVLSTVQSLTLQSFLQKEIS